MMRLKVPITDKTRIGAIRDGMKLYMRIEMYNVSTGERYYEQRWEAPGPPAKPLAMPTNGYGQCWRDWEAAIARARPSLQR